MHARFLSKSLIAASSLALVLGLAACGDDDDSESTGDDTEETVPADESEDDTRLADGGEDAGAADEGTDDGAAAAAGVTAADFSFTVAGPVAAGSEVTFDNTGSAPHTATADEGDAFDTGRVDGGASGSFTAPSEAGDYAFHCDVHPNMTATLTVE